MENMARGLAMRKSFQQSTIAFAAGVLLTAAAGYLFLTPVQHAQAQVANGNDKFSMVTVPISAGNENYAVFVLNHLTGVLRGAALNNSTGTSSALSRLRFRVGRENGVRYRKPERPEGCFAFSVPDPLFQRMTQPELLPVTKHKGASQSCVNKSKHNVLQRTTAQFGTNQIQQ
jgi:hypothetical protein